MTCTFLITFFASQKLIVANTSLNRYPPKMIPGCHIMVHTTATNDRDARLLLSSIGIPFYGKQIN